MPDNCAIFVIFATLLSKFYVCSSQNIKVCDNVLGQAFRPDFEDCSKYHLCSPRKDWVLFCDPGMAWNQEKSTCVTKGSVNDTCSLNSLQQYKQKVMAEKLELTHPSSSQQLEPPLTSPDIKSAMDRWSAKFFCPAGATGKFAHPTKCAQYYDCSKANSMEWWGQNFRECSYPKLYNEVTKDCESPSKVNCNARQQPIDPCEYVGNQCRSSHCVPCHIRYATCRGLPNGLHQWRGREMTSYFIVCKNERVIFHGRCQESKPGQFMVFSISLQTCVDRQKAETVREENLQNLLIVHQAKGQVANLTKNPQFPLSAILMNETEVGYYTNTSKELQQINTTHQNQTELQFNQATNQTLTDIQQNRTKTAFQQPPILQSKPIQLERKPVIPPQQPVLLPQQPVIPPYQNSLPPYQHVLSPQQHVLPHQHPVIPPHQPAVLPQQPVVPPQQPVIAHQQPVRPSQQPVVLPQRQVIQPHQPVIPPQQHVLPHQHPVIPPQKPGVLPRQPVIQPQQYVLPPHQPVIAHQQPVRTSQQPGVLPQQPVIPPQQPVIAHQEPVRPSQQPVVFPHEQVIQPYLPVIPPQQTVIQQQQPVILHQQSVRPSQQPVVLPQEQVIQPYQPVIPPQQTVIPQQQPVILHQQSVIPQQQSVILPHQPIFPHQQPVKPPNQHVRPWHQSLIPHQQTVIPQQQPVLLNQQPVIPYQQSVILPHQSVFPHQQPVKPPNQHVRPWHQSVIPPRQPVVPPQPSVTLQQQRQPPSVQQQTSEPMHNLQTTKKTAKLEVKGIGVHKSSSGTDQISRLAGVNFLSGNKISFGKAQFPLMVETTKSININPTNRTQPNSNKENLQTIYNFSKPLTAPSNIVKIVPNSWAGINNIIQNNANSGTTLHGVEAATMPTKDVFPDLSKMGNRIDILPLPNVNKENTIASSKVTNNPNIEKTNRHLNLKSQMSSFRPVEPLTTRKHNDTMPTRQARLPVVHSDPRIRFMNNRPSALAVSPIANSSEPRKTKPMHPAMFSSFPEQSGISKKSAWSPVAFMKNSKKGTVQAVSKHTTATNRINIKGKNFRLARQNKTRLFNLLLDVLDQIKQNATILSLKKKISFMTNKTVPETTQNMVKEVTVPKTTQNMVKEVNATPTPVVVQNQKPTEVISMDVIPDKNVLSNKHIPNIERVVTKMQNHAVESASTKTTSAKTPARMVFLPPLKFSSAKGTRNVALQMKKHSIDNNALSSSATINLNQDNTTPTINQVLDSNTILPHSKTQNRKTSLPISLWRTKISKMGRQNNMKSTENRNVHGHQYSELVERLNYLGTSGRGRLSRNSRILPLATLKEAKFALKHRMFKQRKPKLPTVATFSGRLNAV